MSDPATFGPFRMQAYRLAWLTTYMVFAVSPLMWVLPDGADSALGVCGAALLVIEGMFSIVARRFAPFGWALLGFLVLVASAPA